MNDSVKFPNTLDASVWASRCTAWFGAFKVPDLAEWFQAALSHGFREGQASVYELVNRAHRQRDLYGLVVPGTRAPEPPSVEERLAALEAGQKAVGRFWAGERLSDTNFILNHLKKLEATTKELSFRHLLDENRAAAIEDGLCNHHERLTKLEART